MIIIIIIVTAIIMRFLFGSLDSHSIIHFLLANNWFTCWKLFPTSSSSSPFPRLVLFGVFQCKTSSAVHTRHDDWIMHSSGLVQTIPSKRENTKMVHVKERERANARSSSSATQAMFKDSVQESRNLSICLFAPVQVQSSTSYSPSSWTAFVLDSTVCESVLNCH